MTGYISSLWLKMRIAEWATAWTVAIPHRLFSGLGFVEFHPEEHRQINKPGYQHDADDNRETDQRRKQQQGEIYHEQTGQQRVRHEDI
jgi:hypothetical protein